MEKSILKKVEDYFKNASVVVAINTITEIELTTKKFKYDKLLDCVNEIDDKGSLITTNSDFHCVYHKGKFSEIIKNNESAK